MWSYFLECIIMQAHAFCTSCNFWIFLFNTIRRTELQVAKTTIDNKIGYYSGSFCVDMVSDFCNSANVEIRRYTDKIHVFCERESTVGEDSGGQLQFIFIKQDFI